MLIVERLDISWMNADGSKNWRKFLRQFDCKLTARQVSSRYDDPGDTCRKGTFNDRLKIVLKPRKV